MSLEERWDSVEFENLQGAPCQLKEPRAVVAKHLVPAGGETVRLPIIPENHGEPLQRKLYVLRGDVERPGTTDKCLACTNIILGNRATVTHSATCLLGGLKIADPGVTTEPPRGLAGQLIFSPPLPRRSAALDVCVASSKEAAARGPSIERKSRLFCNVLSFVHWSGRLMGGHTQRSRGPRNIQQTSQHAGMNNNFGNSPPTQVEP